MPSDSLCARNQHMMRSTVFATESGNNCTTTSRLTLGLAPMITSTFPFVSTSNGYTTRSILTAVQQQRSSLSRIRRLYNRSSSVPASASSWSEKSNHLQGYTQTRAGCCPPTTRASHSPCPAFLDRLARFPLRHV